MSPALRFALAGAAALALSQAALGADLVAGKEKAAQVCGACHGPNGEKPTQPDYPILAGQWPDYLERALKDYKSGKRKNPIMNGMAAALSDQDIENVAAWFASQPSPLHSER
jgi:cytochrome c553